MTNESNGGDEARAGAGAESRTIVEASKDPRNAIIDALLELASERGWDDITISDIASRANVSLATFRDHFPSKGAILAGFSRRIDRIVLEAVSSDMAGEPLKERLFDVLMRRLDALAPYKLGLEAIYDWASRDPLAASALNGVAINSMRFMLEAAGIDSEGPVGVFKLQGLAFGWARVLRVWFRDDDPGLASTMAALDRELTRGSTLVARAQDVNRLVSPLFSLARSLFVSRPSRMRTRDSRQHEGGGERTSQ
ncbi:MAG: TetR/AcrR family transcriptional regulator [Beijerinckiaceae bacterium]|nr:TetR/AcrR family transcriptional regulator [Beijerinckiaceae bacterium]MCI0735247.1 TetR/AcrR family transcriptional regulator [Beijerinckiaceae bacterium]